MQGAQRRARARRRRARLLSTHAAAGRTRGVAASRDGRSSHGTEQPWHVRALRCRPPDRHRLGRLETVLARGCLPQLPATHSLAPCALSAVSAHTLAARAATRTHPPCACRPPGARVPESVRATSRHTVFIGDAARHGARQCRPMSAHMRVYMALQSVKDRVRHRALASHHPEESRALGRPRLCHLAPTARPPRFGPRGGESRPCKRAARRPRLAGVFPG